MQPPHCSDHHNQPSHPADAGFTLLELIIVLVVLGILAAIVIPRFDQIVGRAQDEAIIQTAQAFDRNLRNLASFDTHKARPLGDPRNIRYINQIVLGPDGQPDTGDEDIDPTAAVTTYGDNNSDGLVDEIALGPSGPYYHLVIIHDTNNNQTCDTQETYARLHLTNQPGQPATIQATGTC